MPTDRDRNLLFGVLALQAGLLDADRFAEACAAWASRKGTTLADLLLERGWLTGEDRAHLDYLLRRNLERHAGDPQASLVAVTTDGVRQLVADLTNSQNDRPADAVSGPDSTVAHLPERRGRYTLNGLHARGGIGQVWLARDTDLGREVALKEPRPERADVQAVLDRFLAEARVTGQLEHPGIVPVYELARPTVGQPPFYTMRFIRGRTLAVAAADYHRRLATGEAGVLELRELLTAFVSVCNAVAYAHSRGVLHRDLKGQNVVLGDFGEVVVLDWGLAKVVGSSEEQTGSLPVNLDPAAPHGATQEGQILGTPAYMSPEQAQGKLDLVGPPTDVYGLGALLYEILTGTPPFAGADTPEVLAKVVGEPPVPPRHRVPTTPTPLEAVCLKALAKPIDARYPTALELAGEVRRWLADEPVTALREPWTGRALRWARRHRTVATTGVAILLTLAVSLGVAAAFLAAAGTRERLARENADDERRAADLQREAALAESQRATEATAAAERRFGLALAMLDRVVLRNLMNTQTRTLDEAERMARTIEERPGKKPTPEEERRMLALAGTEIELTRQVDAVIRVLQSEGGGFPEVFLQCRQDLIQVARHLRKGAVDLFVLQVMKDLKVTFEDMATALRKLRRLSPDRLQEARDAYSDACLWALTAEAVREDTRVAPAERTRLAEERAATAVRMLRQARDKGFGESELLQRDTALDVLRERDDFKQLLAEIEKEPALK